MRDFLEGRRGRGPTAKRNPPGNTWKDRVIYCYGRPFGVVVCGCREGGSGASASAPGSSLSPSASHSLCRLALTRWDPAYLRTQIPASRCRNTRLLSTPISRLLCLPRDHRSRTLPLQPPGPRSVLLLCRALSGPFCNVCNGPPTPGIPRWVSNTYLHGRGTTVSVPSSADPVHTPRFAASTTATATGTALNLSYRTTLLHYLERLIRNYYLDRDTDARIGGREREGQLRRRRRGRMVALIYASVKSASGSRTPRCSHPLRA